MASERPAESARVSRSREDSPPRRTGARDRSAREVVFFDVDTLGGLRISAPPARMLDLNAYPYLTSVLQQLTARKVRLGLISRVPGVAAEGLSAALVTVGIDIFFDQDLRIFAADGVEGEAGAILDLAAGTAGIKSSPASCMLVSEDNIVRGQALAAGWRVRRTRCWRRPFWTGQAMVRAHSQVASTGRGGSGAPP